MEGQGDGGAPERSAIVIFRHMCFLFSSCDVFTDTCVDCSSGVLQCTVCHFQDTMPDGTCAACEWFLFGWNSL